MVYDCSFFKEINSDMSFHILEECQYDLFLLTAVSRTFLKLSQCVSFPFHGLSFPLRLIEVNQCLALL